MKFSIVSNIALVLLSVIFASSCQSPDSHRSAQGKQITLPAGQVHEGWYFAAGDQVIIDGTINGDAYIGAAMVDINGTINGDLIVGGGQVTVGGTVTDDIRGAGGVVRLSGHTGKNVTVSGGSLIITREAEIGKNLLAAGGDIQIRGTIGQEAKLGGGVINVTGTIKGDVDAATGQMSVHQGATIGGNLTVYARDTTGIAIDQGTVRGSTHLTLTRTEGKHFFLGMTRGGFWFRVLFTLSLLATALLLVFLLPHQLEEAGVNILQRPGLSALWGFLVLIVAPVVMVLLFITVIGIPLGILLLFLYLWFCYLSQLTLGIALGNKLFGFDGKSGWRLFGSVALGVVIVQILTFIPYLRFLTVIAGLIFGVGAFAMITRDELESRRTR